MNKQFLPAILCSFCLTLNCAVTDTHAETKRVLSASEKLALRQAAHHPITKLTDLPLPVRENLGLVKNPKEIAEPGERWEPGCTSAIGVPHERLILAAASPNACVVHCELGGYARYFTVRFYTIEGNTAKLVTELNEAKKYTTLDEIVAALQK